MKRFGFSVLMNGAAIGAGAWQAAVNPTVYLLWAILGYVVLLAVFFHWAAWGQRQAEKRYEILRRISGARASAKPSILDRCMEEHGRHKPDMVERMLADEQATERLLADLGLSTD